MTLMLTRGLVTGVVIQVKMLYSLIAGHPVLIVVNLMSLRDYDPIPDLEDLNEIDRTLEPDDGCEED